MGLIQFQETSEKIGIITLNAPDILNAMSEKMAEEFRSCVSSLSSKKPLRGIILTGAGKAFSAGGDLEMLDKKRSLTGEQNRIRMLDFYDSFLSIRRLNVPLVAAINGAAIGAGMCLAAACDIRIASPGVKLGFTFVKLGLHPGMGATYTVPKIVGVARAMELLLPGRIIESEYAEKIGLINEITKDSVVTRSQEFFNEIASCGPESVSQLLETLRGGDEGFKKALEREALCQSINYAGTEFAEGLSSVKEKRKANF